jgi:hypothetical protein
MHKIYVYSTGRPETSEITYAFAQGIIASESGWKPVYLDIKEHPHIPLDANAIAILGILRGTGLLIREAAQKKIDYYYMDHAYFNQGYSGQGWIRITKNSHSINYISKSDGSRWKNFFSQKNPIKNWVKQTENKNILIIPPTNAIQWFFSAEKWTQKMLKSLEKCSSKDTEIIVRKKTNEPIVDAKGNLIRLQENHVSRPLEDDIIQARLVVAYNSTVAIDALRMGLPVVTSKNSCCNPLSEKIDALVFQTRHQPPEPKRLKLFEWLSDNQFNRSEITDGSAWKTLLCRK